MGQCCSLTYTQFDVGLNWKPDFSTLSLSGFTIAASNPQTFSVYEANAVGAVAGDAGDYVQVPAGFAVQLQLTPAGGDNSQNLIVIALRGSRTWDEWFADTDAFPVAYASEGLLSAGLGSVHAGFYGLYTIGENGAQASGNPLDPNVSQRASGSIASQIGSYVNSLPGGLSSYVTGHSLGAALASLCALDIAHNFSGKCSEIFMYNLASPRVAVGLSDAFGILISTLDNQLLFLANYQKYVPNSYQVIHSADIVPILPPLSTSLGPISLNTAQVTDPYQIGSGATADANIAGESVTSINVTNRGPATLLPFRQPSSFQVAEGAGLPLKLVSIFLEE